MKENQEERGGERTGRKRRKGQNKDKRLKGYVIISRLAGSPF